MLVEQLVEPIVRTCCMFEKYYGVLKKLFFTSHLKLTQTIILCNNERRIKSTGFTRHAY